ncbi:denticleless protein homolog B-like [Dreissena polymorpha]|uniref:denticleless protein homolog B-like n=1 Tax=Dreissena polymorpha TaxID=45954 RepID=UPI0022650D2C|nr:denticleless protein homolog B-like [Dreissena polymorpha]
MILKYRNKLSTGVENKNKKSLQQLVDPCLLENINCHSTDEYPVTNTDEEEWGTPIPPLACSFNKLTNSCHILALVDENGSLVLYNTNLAGDEAVITDWSAHNNAVFDVEWSCSDHKLLTASGDQTVCLWDSHCKTKLLTFKGHTSSVRSVKYRPHDSSVFASGSRDGHVRIWDSRCNIKEGKVSCVDRIKNAHSMVQQTPGKKKKSRLGAAQTQDSQQSVTAVIFQDENILTTAGAVDGCIKVWDIRKIKPETSTPVYSFPYAGTSKRTHGFSSLVFDCYKSRLFASCTDDVIYSYDFIRYTPTPVAVYRGHRNTSFYVKAVLSPDSRFLLSGSSDEHAYIWQVDNPGASPVILKGHSSEVSDVAWCNTDTFRIVTTSDDNTMRVWRYNAVAREMKKLGKQDPAVIGTAECTHRDIGTSAFGPQTPKRSPNSTLKRSATVPFGPVTETTPKRARTSASSTPSPSIKMWLKRTASEPLSSIIEHSSYETSAYASSNKSSFCSELPVCLKQATTFNSTADGDTNSQAGKVCASFSSKEVRKTPLAECLLMDGSSRSPKRIKIEFKNPVDIGLDSGCLSSETVRKSCKRKLIASENDPSPKQHKRQRLFGLGNENQEVLKNKLTNPTLPSPGKKLSPLKDLDSEYNKSPEKVTVSKMPLTPARVSLCDWNSMMYQSPTANLPNIVLDGPQVNTVAMAEPEGKKKTVDWLTHMRIQKMSTKGPQGKSVSLDKARQAESELTKDGGTIMSSPRMKTEVKGLRAITSFFGQSVPKS